MRRASRKLYKDTLEVGQPIVCAVNGPAIGAGCSLVLLSDFACASSTVTLSDPYVRRGLAAADGAAIWTMDFRSQNHREAIAAFKEGRPPVFTGS
jgi:enoyl-CoA hydratase/carnithine racemase